jgi:hypothetical protein
MYVATGSICWYYLLSYLVLFTYLLVLLVFDLYL